MVERGRDPFSQFLYPMLSEQPSLPAEVLETLAQAPIEKSAESNRLRREVLAEYATEMARCGREMAGRFRSGGRLLACGNGGSATAAADVAVEFLCPESGRPLPALSLTNDIAVVTAIANDVSFDDVFQRQIIALSQPEDMLLAISTSGNSENLLRAMETAKPRGLQTVGLAGYDGGKMAHERRSDYCFVVRSSSVHRIQEVQTTLYHALMRLVQRLMEEDHVPSDPGAADRIPGRGTPVRQG